MARRKSFVSNSEQSTQSKKNDETQGHVEDRPEGIMGVFREWSDALIIAFVLAMFVRVFVVELFKIPTGSMSPTLLGDEVAHVDWNNDGLEDIVIRGSYGKHSVFVKNGDHYEYDESASVSDGDIRSLLERGLMVPQYDRILVNKFSYWFGLPDRGDVIVFKVPEPPWEIDKPIYIKRVIGLPEDTLTFDGQLVVDGSPADEPEFFSYWKYTNKIARSSMNFGDQTGAVYDDHDRFTIEISEMKVSENEIYVFGDNTHSSLDSRFWGGVPVDNIKGKAFFRYWPMKSMKFIR